MAQAHEKLQHRPAGPWDVEKGTCCLVRGKSLDPSYRLFQRLTDNGVPGLCVSRTHPDRVRARYTLADVRIGWISSGPGDDNFDPAAVGTLANAITEFIDRHPNGSIVILEGIEYIMANLGFAKTLSLVQHLNEFVMPRRTMILLPIDPECFETTELAQLERSMDGIEDEGLRSVLDADEADTTTGSSEILFRAPY